MTTLRYMPTLHFVILTLFVYRVTRALVIDEIFSDIRDLIWTKFPPETSYLGYFFTCAWCISLWVALPIVVLYAFFPGITLLIGYIFALSALAGLITARVDN